MNKEARGKVGRILLLVGRLALAVIFLYAAYAKMKPAGTMPWSVASVRTSLAMFALGVDSYNMLPPWAVSPVAYLLPPFELFLGLWLLSGIGLRFSSLVSALLVGGFVGVMVSAYERGLTISCGCFGPGEQVGPRTLIRDGLLFLPLALGVMIGAFVTGRKPSASAASTEIPAAHSAE
ncbi:MAG: DoxX family membrane protein [Acidobacteriia bacterium]|nr:DoxX family membrane protein [Terriglobia bacterium]